MFKKEERSSFKYWFAHWCAFQMVALSCHAWKPKYLLHDIEKPWLKLLWKDYKKVQKWHRRHNSHHVEYPGPKDYEAMCIDWDCSRFTKSNGQLNAYYTFLWYRCGWRDCDMSEYDYRIERDALVGSGNYDNLDSWDIVKALKKLGMWDYSENGDISGHSYDELESLKIGDRWSYNNSKIY